MSGVRRLLLPFRLYMTVIEWVVLFIIGIGGLYLGGIALGLLSGMGLACFTFLSYLYPAPPPYDLIVIQAAWLIFSATLEAVGFFGFLEDQLRVLPFRLCYPFRWIFFCACCISVFITGNSRLVYKVLVGNLALRWHALPMRLSIPTAVITHITLLISPFSMTGLLFLLLIRGTLWSRLYLVAIMVGLIILVLFIHTIVCNYMPYRRLSKRYMGWVCADFRDETLSPNFYNSSKWMIYSCLFFFLLLIGGLLLSARSITITGVGTALACTKRIFLVKISMFFALTLLSVAALVMLSLRVKPVQILQTNRFKVGIEHLFNFLGFIWLIETLIDHDPMIWISLLRCMVGGCAIKCHYGLILILCCFLFLIDTSVFIWFFIPLSIQSGCSAPMIAMAIVAMHSLAPIRQWIGHKIKRKTDT